MRGNVVKSRYGKRYADYERCVSIEDMVCPMELGGDIYA